MGGIIGSERSSTCQLDHGRKCVTFKVSLSSASASAGGVAPVRPRRAPYRAEKRDNTGTGCVNWV
jgi:hypothetical protein